MLNASQPLKGEHLLDFFSNWIRDKQYFNFGAKYMNGLASFLIQITGIFPSNSNFNELNSLH